jgi:hypothetical protein
MSAVFVHLVPDHAMDNEPAFLLKRGRSRMWSRRSGRGAAEGIELGFICDLKS